ncbi:hypothetical protein [Dactylosporangium sp. CA-139066]|uniref:hypothetical protein n=1 Tax=Dactylosporangium sp. CA-139066 TaxID=3239930 RepID=UPI003D93DF1F
MMRRHTKVLRRSDEDGDEYRPRHLRDSRNTRNDLDLREPGAAALLDDEAALREEDGD